jgi:cardiolipin synthase
LPVQVAGPIHSYPSAPAVRATLRAAAPARPLMAWPRKRIAWVAGAVVATIVATLVVVNLLPPERRVDERIEHRYAVGSPPFFRSLGVLLGPPTLDGNRVVGFQNGDEIFPAMLAAIRGARRTITFETYIYWSGEVGEQFASALVERARARLCASTCCSTGSARRKSRTRLLARMRDAGVEIELYRPLRWYHLARSTTARTASCSSSTGASASPAASASRTSGKATPRIRPLARQPLPREGPVVAQMQATFADNWSKARGVLLHGDDYFPAGRARTAACARRCSRARPKAARTACSSCTCSRSRPPRARSRSRAPISFPTSLRPTPLVEALKRGVRVRILVPGRSSTPTSCGGRPGADGSRCSAAGAEIHEFQPTMFHCKVMVVDELLVLGRARPTSTCARSGSTTRPTSTSTTPRSRGASSRSSSAT